MPKFPFSVFLFREIITNAKIDWFLSPWMVPISKFQIKSTVDLKVREMFDSAALFRWGICAGDWFRRWPNCELALCRAFGRSLGYICHVKVAVTGRIFRVLSLPVTHTSCGDILWNRKAKGRGERTDYGPKGIGEEGLQKCTIKGNKFPLCVSGRRRKKPTEYAQGAKGFRPERQRQPQWN